MDLKDEFLEIKSKIHNVLLNIELPELSDAINNMVAENSYARKIFTVDLLGPEDKATYPIMNNFEEPVWILPGLGYTSQDFMELASEEVAIRMFTVQAAKDWLLRYVEEKRYDVMEMAAKSVANALADYEIEACWRTILPAVTSTFDGAGILPPRPAQVFQLAAGDPASGYFSKELINRMIVAAQRNGQVLEKILVSPEDFADIREWTDADVDSATRSRIFQAAGLGKIWDIEIEVTNDLGVRGKYNINGVDSKWGPFKANREHKFNDYSVLHGNILDENGLLVRAGETQIIGLCKSRKENLIMPLVPYVAHFDWTLLRKQKLGFFGWQKMGMMCQDSRCLVMGVIDRFTPTMGSGTQSVRAINQGSFASQMSELLRRN